MVDIQSLTAEIRRGKKKRRRRKKKKKKKKKIETTGQNNGLPYSIGWPMANLGDVVYGVVR